MNNKHKVDIDFWYFIMFFSVLVGIGTDGLEGFIISLGIMEMYLVFAIIIVYFKNKYECI